MKVSVAMITYNHEKFVAQAIESVVQQKRPFPIELIIFDDASTDRTASIIEEYASQHDFIKPTLRTQNVGMSHNFEATLQACTGDYIALLEGDDYWTSPNKLEAQVGQLESNPETVISFHPTLNFHQESQGQDFTYPRDLRPSYSLQDLCKENFMNTCSVMYRRSAVPVAFPKWMHQVRSSDWALHMLTARHGGIQMVDECMGAYRIHAGGVWSGAAFDKRLASEQEMLQHIALEMPEEARPTLETARVRKFFEAAAEYAARGEKSAARKQLKLWRDSGGLGVPKSWGLKLFVKTLLP